MATAISASDIRGRETARSLAPVQAWLYVVAILIVAMVLVGGATRLTGSGLSITEWQPIHGVIPPLGDADWQEEFAKYQAIPEFKLVNPDMTLSAFKGIFWWEWAHRLLGRIIGVVFFVPLIWFVATRRIGRGLAPQLLGILALGALQGAVGWWMVASGLVERTDVSQYRLAVHLTLALAILAFILWVARGLSPQRVAVPAWLRRSAAWILGLVFLQVFLGALVAGLDAGLVSSSWPTMNGALVPDGMFLMEPAWRNLFENPVTTQFDHRLVAYVILAFAAVHAVRAHGTAAARGAVVLMLAVAAQAAIGINAIVHDMPLAIALLHQLGAVAVLSVAVIHLRGMVPVPAAAGVPATA